jgi:5-methylcytosine-specific restriction endonuclease McrA
MLACKYCSRECHKNGHKYHESYCKQNPSPLPPRKVTQKFLDAMAKRKGNVKNQYTNIKWENLPFEDLSPRKKRERLLKEAEYKCTQCSYSKTRSCGGIILEIDHIDGDYTNNAKDNLRVLCPNCHALTHNFRNWDRSTKKTSKRIRKGNKIV